jgi:1,4-dihydroxy-2-naphthoyl-CoA hydrolase
MQVRERTLQQINELGTGYLPGHMGVVFTELSGVGIHAEILVRQCHMAPNGYLHAGTVVTLADTAAGYGCTANLPEGALGFTTVELKANYLGTARDGTIECVAIPVHLGRSTQVWDATVKHRESGKTIALFRCTQMLLYAKSSA